MKFSSKTLILILSLIVILAIFSFGCGTKKDVEETEVKVKAIPVETAETRQGTFTKTVILSGIAQPQKTITVTPKMSEKLISFNLEVGDRVSAGQTIGVLEQNSINIQLKNVQINYEDTLMNYERIKALFETGAVSKSELEKLEIALKQIENNLEAQRIAYDNTFIKAPISGVISAVHTEAGTIVSPQSPIVTIADIDTLEVNTGINEMQVNKIKAGTEVEVLVPSAENGIFKGRIKTISPTMDERIKAYPLIIAIENKENKIKAGMYAEVELVTDVAKEAIIVPTEAVISRNGDSRVFVVEEDKALLVEVEPGLSNAHETQVLKGLKKGDQVIIRGNEDVINGDLVTVVNRGEK